MITKSILSLLFGVVDLLLGFLPSFTWIVDNSIIDVFYDIIDGATYFLPMDTVGEIIGIVIAINIFRIVMTLIKTILKFIPFI